VADQRLTADQGEAAITATGKRQWMAASFFWREETLMDARQTFVTVPAAAAELSYTATRIYQLVSAGVLIVRARSKRGTALLRLSDVLLLGQERQRQKSAGV
jgi:hypothetical protein